MSEAISDVGGGSQNREGTSFSEILFTVVLGILAVGGIWLSSSLLIYLARG